MILPCETCIYRTERREGHRLYIGCSDPERKKNHFHHDGYSDKDTCDAYVRDINKKRHK